MTDAASGFCMREAADSDVLTEIARAKTMISSRPPTGTVSDTDLKIWQDFSKAVVGRLIKGVSGCS